MYWRHFFSGQHSTHGDHSITPEPGISALST
jgi:hypothetical protein